MNNINAALLGGTILGPVTADSAEAQEYDDHAIDEVLVSAEKGMTFNNS